MCIRDSYHCAGCIFGKSHRHPFPKRSTRRASKLLELVHSDVLGPLEVKSIGGSQYFITFIDDYSNWTCVYTMAKKSEALNRFKEYKAMTERHTSRALGTLRVHEHRGSADDSNSEPLTLKVLRSDNGGEYLSNDFKEFLADHGIKHELTVAYTPQQNGVAERMNRTLLCLLYTSPSPRDLSTSRMPSSA